MEKEILYISPDRPTPIAYKPIVVPYEVYIEITKLAKESNLSIGKVSRRLLEFALDRAVVGKEGGEADGKN